MAVPNDVRCCGLEQYVSAVHRGKARIVASTTDLDWLTSVTNHHL